MNESVSNFFIIVTFSVIAKFFWHWGRTLYALFLSRRLGRTVNLGQHGEWAVVTGATDGIGKAFAFELASRGLSVVLLGRNLQKLRQCAKEIEEKFNTETLIIPIDFAESDHWYGQVREAIAGLTIRILVNNVGMCPSLPDYFHAMDGGEKFMADMIRCNVSTTTIMTRICLPGMVKRKAGVIINVASASALLPTPLVAIYSATKAYVDVFSRALQCELTGSGVTVQSLLPFTVRTKMTGNPEVGFFVADAAEFVRSSLDTVGILDRSHGCLSHSLQGWYYSALPFWISSRLQWNFFSQLRVSLRKARQDHKE